MAYLDLISTIHTKTKRDYLARVTSFPKAEAANRAKHFAYDYWDGDRKFGYGGYHYDGRWRKVADALRDHYKLKPGHRVLDVGCGKGFLLYDLMQSVPGLEVAGMDVSEYAIIHAKEEIKPFIRVANANRLPYPDQSFDFVVSINVLHCLHCADLEQSLREIQRVSRPTAGKYICIESYRNEEEKANLLYWQLTCAAFLSPEDWDWWFQKCNYTGDHGFIFFE